MKNSKSVIAASMFLVIYVSQANANPEQCTESGPTQQNFYDCDTTPDELHVGFYRLALCESRPTFQNDGDCIFLLDRTTPITAPIRFQQTTDLVAGPFSIPEGTYRYAMMLIDNSFGFRARLDFNSNQNDALGNSGSSCWTNGSDILSTYSGNSAFPITCGPAEQAVPSVSNERLSAFFDNDVVDPTVEMAWVNKTEGEEVNISEWEATLLNANLAPANVILPDQTKPFSPSSDARYIFAVQEFKTPPRITSETTNINLGFLTKDKMTAFWQPINNFSLVTVGINGFSFMVEAN